MTKLYLLILYILICLTLALRINVESTGYISPDSEFYLKTASNFIEGKGLITPITYPFDDHTPAHYTAIWPIGYSFLIGSVSYLTNLDTFVSSKLVNAFFLGLTFILLYRWFGEYSLLPACYFCSFNALELYSYTWAEGAFLFFLLWILYLVERIISSNTSTRYAIQLTFALVVLVLVRYAGLAYFFYLAIVYVFLLLKDRTTAARQLFFSLLGSTLLVCLFLSLNYILSGGFFGNEPRIFPEMESWTVFLKKLFNGLINEFLISRKFYWNYDLLFIGLFIIQLLVMLFILYKKESIHFEPLKKTGKRIAIFSGIFYLIFIIVLRKLSPFDTFNYRILAPFSMPVFIILLGNLRFEKTAKDNYTIKAVIVSFFLLSLIMNLPKEFILKWIGIL